jgi:hypothetical protein
VSQIDRVRAWWARWIIGSEHVVPCARRIGIGCKGPPACMCWCHESPTDAAKDPTDV